MSSCPIRWGDWPASVRDDPFPWFANMRQRDSVVRATLADGHEAWIVLGYAAARQALAHSALSKDLAATLDGDADVVAEGLPGRDYAHHMLNVDPPDHTRLRTLIAPAFTSSKVAALVPTIRGIADDLLDRLAARGANAAVDAVTDYARPLPFRVLARMLDVPEEDTDALHDSFRALLAPWTGQPPAEAVAASAHITGYLDALIEKRRRRPGDDLVSHLVTAATESDRLSERELRSSLFQLVVAGHDTTTSLIGNAIVALLDHSEQRQALLDDPALLTTAIDELVRFTAPVPHGTFRVTRRATDLDGCSIPAGRQVVVCLAAANRDPARYEHPDVLDLRRRAAAHLGFGHGIHYCLGAGLARLEARVAIGALLGRFPGLRLAVPRDRLRWAHGDGLVLRGLSELPIVLAT